MCLRPPLVFHDYSARKTLPFPRFPGSILQNISCLPPALPLSLVRFVQVTFVSVQFILFCSCSLRGVDQHAGEFTFARGPAQFFGVTLNEVLQFTPKTLVSLDPWQDSWPAVSCWIRELSHENPDCTHRRLRIEQQRSLALSSTFFPPCCTATVHLCKGDIFVLVFVTAAATSRLDIILRF